MDFFLNNGNVTERLINEWRKHGKIIIAYDFDNTVFDYTGVGATFHDVVSLLQECRKYAHFIVFTSCEDKKLPMIEKYLKDNEIPFDTINENLPFIPFTGRKVYYNILLDDRAGLSSAYEALKEALGVIKSNY